MHYLITKTGLKLDIGLNIGYNAYKLKIFWEDITMGKLLSAERCLLACLKITPFVRFKVLDEKLNPQNT